MNNKNKIDVNQHMHFNTYTLIHRKFCNWFWFRVCTSSLFFITYSIGTKGNCHNNGQLLMPGAIVLNWERRFFFSPISHYWVSKFVTICIDFIDQKVNCRIHSVETKFNVTISCISMEHQWIYLFSCHKTSYHLLSVIIPNSCTHTVTITRLQINCAQSQQSTWN